ncbi:MAG: enolase C-terminal domain-like protein [Acidimicrobiales bacterium]
MSPRAGSVIRVTITHFRHEVADLGQERRKGFDTVYRPGEQWERHGAIVSIETDAGLRGEALSLSGVWEQSDLRGARYLLHRDPLDRAQIWFDLKRAARMEMTVPPGGIDCALWDLAGKFYEAPVYELLGGAWRTSLPSYASTFHGDVDGGLATPEDYAAFALRCRDEHGYQAFKIHGWVGAPIDQEIATVMAVREAVGAGMDLMIDPAGAYTTFADALRIGRACDEAGFFWLEDAFAAGSFSIAAHLRLRDRVRTPLLVGEHLRGFEAKADAIRLGAADFIRASWFEDGGITGVMKIAALAEAFGVDVELHGGGLAHRQCMAVLRNSNYFEVGLLHPNIAVTQTPLYEDPRWVDNLDAVDEHGCLAVPDGPGLGVDFDWAWIDDHTERVDVVE